MEKKTAQVDQTRVHLRKLDAAVSFVLGEASAENTFNSRVKKLNTKGRQNVLPPETRYRELPLKMAGGAGNEIGLFFRYLIPGFLSVVLKRSYWIQGPLETLPIFGFWALGDLMGLGRAGLTLSHKGRGKEVFLKALVAAIPGAPTAPLHSVIDRYMAERYIDYSTKAVKEWRKTLSPLVRSDYRQNFGTG